MTTELEAAKPERPEAGVSAIFWALIAAFALLGAMLAAGDAGGIAVFGFVFVGWIISLCLHEWGHAATAWAGGDQSIEERGYLTLNPLRYANPMLSIVMPLIFLAMGGIGFPGGAVYINQSKLRGPLWRAAVSAAGPGMNLVCLIAIGLVFGLSDPGATAFGGALALLGFLQATALLLNLLPVPGLDGFGILNALLPAGVRAAIAPLSSLTLIAFLVVMVTAPQFLQPLWDAAFRLCEIFSIDTRAIARGIGLFRFWEASSNPFTGAE